MYEDEPLKDYYTLMDIAYIYTWRRVSSHVFLLSDLTPDCYLTHLVLNLQLSVLLKQGIYLSSDNWFVFGLGVLVAQHPQFNNKMPSIIFAHYIEWTTASEIPRAAQL